MHGRGRRLTIDVGVLVSHVDAAEGNTLADSFPASFSVTYHLHERTVVNRDSTLWYVQPETLDESIDMTTSTVDVAMRDLRSWMNGSAITGNYL